MKIFGCKESKRISCIVVVFILFIMLIMQASALTIRTGQGRSGEKAREDGSRL
jgi:hypothetical protein